MNTLTASSLATTVFAPLSATQLGLPKRSASAPISHEWYAVSGG